MCTATVDAATGDTFVDIADLVAGKRYYKVSVSGIINAKVAKQVSDTVCESAASASFSPIIDTGKVPLAEYNHNVMPTSTATYSAFSS